MTLVSNLDLGHFRTCNAKSIVVDVLRLSPLLLIVFCTGITRAGIKPLKGIKCDMQVRILSSPLSRAIPVSAWTPSHLAFELTAG